MRHTKQDATLAKVLAAASGMHWTGGARCATCKLENVERINEDLRTYVAARQSGNPMPLTGFVREWLVKVHQYPFGAEALRKHMRRCLRVGDGI